VQTFSWSVRYRTECLYGLLLRQRHNLWACGHIAVLDRVGLGKGAIRRARPFMWQAPTRRHRAGGGEATGVQFRALRPILFLSPSAQGLANREETIQGPTAPTLEPDYEIEQRVIG